MDTPSESYRRGLYETRREIERLMHQCRETITQAKADNDDALLKEARWRWRVLNKQCDALSSQIIQLNRDHFY